MNFGELFNSPEPADYVGQRTIDPKNIARLLDSCENAIMRDEPEKDLCIALFPNMLDLNSVVKNAGPGKLPFVRWITLDGVIELWNGKHRLAVLRIIFREEIQELEMAKAEYEAGTITEAEWQAAFEKAKNMVYWRVRFYDISKHCSLNTSSLV